MAKHVSMGSHVLDVLERDLPERRARALRGPTDSPANCALTGKNMTRRTKTKPLVKGGSHGAWHRPEDRLTPGSAVNPGGPDTDGGALAPLEGLLFCCLLGRYGTQDPNGLRQFSFLSPWEGRASLS